MAKLSAIEIEQVDAFLRKRGATLLPRVVQFAEIHMPPQRKGYGRGGSAPRQAPADFADSQDLPDAGA